MSDTVENAAAADAGGPEPSPAEVIASAEPPPPPVEAVPPPPEPASPTVQTPPSSTQSPPAAEAQPTVETPAADPADAAVAEPPAVATPSAGPAPVIVDADPPPPPETTTEGSPRPAESDQHAPEPAGGPSSVEESGGAPMTQTVLADAEPPPPVVEYAATTAGGGSGGGWNPEGLREIRSEQDALRQSREAGEIGWTEYEEESRRLDGLMQEWSDERDRAVRQWIDARTDELREERADLRQQYEDHEITRQEYQREHRRLLREQVDLGLGDDLPDHFRHPERAPDGGWLPRDTDGPDAPATGDGDPQGEGPAQSGGTIGDDVVSWARDEDGTVTYRHRDGSVTVTRSDGSTERTDADGNLVHREEVQPDGTRVVTYGDGTTEVIDADGNAVDPEDVPDAGDDDEAPGDGTAGDVLGPTHDTTPTDADADADADGADAGGASAGGPDADRADPADTDPAEPTDGVPPTAPDDVTPVPGDSIIGHYSPHDGSDEVGPGQGAPDQGSGSAAGGDWYAGPEPELQLPGERFLPDPSGPAGSGVYVNGDGSTVTWSRDGEGHVGVAVQHGDDEPRISVLERDPETGDIVGENHDGRAVRLPADGFDDDGVARPGYGDFGADRPDHDFGRDLQQVDADEDQLHDHHESVWTDLPGDLADAAAAVPAALADAVQDLAQGAVDTVGAAVPALHDAASAVVEQVVPDADPGDDADSGPDDPLDPVED